MGKEDELAGRLAAMICSRLFPALLWLHPQPVLSNHVHEFHLWAIVFQTDNFTPLPVPCTSPHVPASVLVSIDFPPHLFLTLSCPRLRYSLCPSVYGFACAPLSRVFALGLWTMDLFASSIGFLCINFCFPRLWICHCYFPPTISTWAAVVFGFLIRWCHPLCELLSSMGPL